METIGLLLLGLALGVVVGWLVRDRTTPPPVAVGEPPEVLTARHQAVLEQVRRQEAEARSEIQSDLASAQASVDELRDALAAARAQHQELLTQQRVAQQERERSETGQTQVLKTLTPVVEHLRTMQRKVDDLERSRVAQHAELATQIKHT